MKTGLVKLALEILVHFDGRHAAVEQDVEEKGPE